ncbi:AsmA-like C-terminal region-containing protein, partial [Leptospira sp. 96542]|nr:AsmA-like C-terminal region-containing protein [Leptospira sp. 96542]
VAGAPRVQLAQSQVQIPELGPGLRVQTDLNFTGALDEMLQRLVAASPLSVLREGALSQVRATGDAAVRLRLDLPLADLKASTVQGQLLLAGNTLRPAPGLPALTQTRGIVHFSEQGFALSGVHARLMGGEVQAEGGTMPVPGAVTLQSTFRSALMPVPAPMPSSQPRLRVQGQFTAQGLRQAGQDEGSGDGVRKLAALARQMEGAARYEAEFGMDEGAPEFLLRTDLRGLALSLPAPLRKPADQTLPVRLQLERLSPRDEGEANLVTPDAATAGGRRAWHDRFSLDVGRLLQLRYERVHLAHQERPRVLRGQMQLDLVPQDAGPSPREALALPDTGVRAVLRLGTLDVNTWLDALRQGADTRGETTQAPRAASVEAGRTAADPAWLDYLPTQLRLLADRVQIGKQSLHDLEVEASRDRGSWRAQLAAQETSGEINYRMPLGTASDEGGAADKAGYLHARLARLVLSTTAAEVDPLKAVDPGRSAEQSRDILSLSALDLPALDVVIEQLRLGDQRLGRVEVEAGHVPAPAALNVSAQAGPAWIWQLRRLRIVLPEADFTAQGQWPAASPEPPAPGAAVPAPRHSTVDFQLSVKDAGGLLARLGKPGLIGGGAGRMQGQLAWDGLPWRPAVAALDGSLSINIERGQFLTVEPGAARLLGVLSLQSLPRRLMLDFRDFFPDGFAFDFVRG